MRIMNSVASAVLPHWPAAVVASAFLTGVRVARSLERRGVRVVLIDCDTNQHGFRSVYGETLSCPNPDREPAAWLTFMQELANRLGGKPALFAASDQFATAIGRFARELQGLFRLSDTAELQMELAVKDGQVRLAARHGLPGPRTGYASSLAELASFAAEGDFPMVLKPRQQRYWQQAPAGHPVREAKALLCNDMASLLATYSSAAEIAPDVVVQELIRGPDTNKRVYLAHYGRRGERLYQLTLAELRCTTFGVPSVCEPIDDPETADVCDRFFRSLGYHGPCEIEVMRDERGGQPKFIDINPRFTGSGDAVQFTGIDPAWLAYLDFIGEPVSPVSPTTLDFRHVSLQNDMSAIRQHFMAGTLSLADLRRTYRAPVRLWDVDPRDWRLAAHALYMSTRTLGGTVLRSFTGALG
jgi:predicted ATP-grasp superfamily ATP-dependent carboligase